MRVVETYYIHLRHFFEVHSQRCRACGEDAVEVERLKLLCVTKKPKWRAR